MYELKRLSQVFQSSKEILFDDSSKFIIMSDCHRGDGSWADDFSKNQNIYFAALTQYYYENYTYIELGDGDEMWENDRISDIMLEHSDAFWLLSRFIKEGKYYSLYGNHDLVKKKNKLMKSKEYEKFRESQKEFVSLFESIQYHEGLILKHAETGDKIFLVHGHQADFLNDRLGRISKFLVKHFWKPLELIGVNDPTRTAKNYKKKEKVAKILTEWVEKEKQMLIAGHTHRSVFPEAGETPYFNDGSCVHPRCITGIEISYGSITLVKWSVKANNDGTLVIDRDILAGPGKLKDYFSKCKSSDDVIDEYGLSLLIKLLHDSSGRKDVK